VSLEWTNWRLSTPVSPLMTEKSPRSRWPIPTMN
jgi:hypothetical protein